MKFIDAFIVFSIIDHMNQTPSLIVNTEIMKNNLDILVKKCQLLSIEFRPHVKTIHAPVLSSILLAKGIKAITVSNIDMFEAFASAGWMDICLAKVCSIDELKQLQSFIDRGVRCSVYVDNIEQLRVLDQVPGPFNVCVDIDSGQYRSGVLWNLESSIIELILLDIDE